jgi:hypothetical protein
MEVIRMSTCSHEGFHTGRGSYAPDAGVLRYVVVCDECQQELREVAAQEYRPQPDLHGNDAYLRAG